MKSHEEGHARGISGWFLIFWTVGEVLLVTHTVLVQDWAVCANAAINLCVMSVIIKYKLKPRPVTAYKTSYGAEYVGPKDKVYKLDGDEGKPL